MTWILPLATMAPKGDIMSIGDDLLRSILLTPEDDLPRLVYADWLEEQGETERAEFIRVQCELAQPFKADWVPTANDLLKYSADQIRNLFDLNNWRPAKRQEALRRRERELLRKHGMEWFKCPTRPGGTIHAPGVPSVTWILGESQEPLCIRRGFVEVVTCSLRDWCGGGCGFCRQGRALGYDGEWNMPCIDCHGTGRGHGPAIVAVQPIMELWISDAHAIHNPALYPICDVPYEGRMIDYQKSIGKRGISWARDEAFKEAPPPPPSPKEHHDAP